MKASVPKSLVQELSLNRANSVKEAILRKFPSLQPNQFSTAGHGLGPAGGPDRSRQPREEPPRGDQGVPGGSGAGRQVDVRRRETLAAGASPLAAADDATPRRRRAVGVVVLLWWVATAGLGAEDRWISPVILPSPLEVIRSFPAC